MSTSGPLILERGASVKLPSGFFCGFWVLVLQATKTLVSFQWANASVYFEEINSIQKSVYRNGPFSHKTLARFLCHNDNKSSEWQIWEEVWLVLSWQGATIALKHCWKAGGAFLVFVRHSCSLHSSSTGLVAGISVQEIIQLLHVIPKSCNIILAK